MSKVAELKEALEKAKKQKATAEKMNAPQAAIDTANSKIEKLTKELEEAEKTPAASTDGDGKKEGEKKVKATKAKPAKKAAKKASKKAAKKEPAKPAKKTAGRRKHTKEEKSAKRKEKAANKVEKTVTIGGKTYTEKDKDFCDKLIQKWEGRKSAMKKAGKKFKTKSISSKVGGDIADAVLKTFKFVETQQHDNIVKNPQSYITKFERADANANKFVSSLKDLLGDDYKSSQVKSELDAIEKAIKAFVAKFKKLKK